MKYVAGALAGAVLTGTAGLTWFYYTFKDLWR